MDAIQFIEPRAMRLIEVPEPSAPGPGEALIRCHRVGVCGTDISGYLGKHPFFSYPRIPGHELGVEVLEVGQGVTGVAPGDRCAVEPYLNNPDSFASRRGLSNCCQAVQVLGVHVDGGLRQRMLVRADKLHRSDTLAYEQLALVETLAIGCHAVNRGDPKPDDTILVIGVGPIGCAVIEFLKLRGCQPVVMDLNEQRLAAVKDMYDLPRGIVLADSEAALEEMRELTGGELFSYVYDVTGSPASMSQAPHYMRHGGTLVYVGNTTGDITFNHSLLQRPEATLKMSRNALPEEFTFIIRAIEQGRIDTERWITHRTDLATMADVFESYCRPETNVLKAVISV